MSIPNFDDMSADDLMNFWSQYHRPRRVEAAALLGGKRPGYTTIVARVAGYAANKAAAIQCRLSGDISGAMTYEAICDAIYRRLPEDLRW